MPNRSVKMSDLMKMTAREIDALSDSEIRKAYQNVKRTAQSRAQTFLKHNEIAPGLLVSLTGSATELTTDQMRQKVKTASYKYREVPQDVSYGAWRAKREEFREKMQKAMPELDLSTQKALDRFGYFMGDMQARYKLMWSAISEFVKDMYEDALELGEDPRRLMDNYEAWKERIEAEDREAREAGLRKGRGRSTSVKRFRNVSGIKRTAERSRRKRRK